MTDRYRVDIRVVARIDDVPVDIDPDAPGNFRSKLIAAANEVVSDRLRLLDVKGGLSGSDGFIDACSVQALVNWDQKS